MEWLKADFHTHTCDCVFDGVPHTACQLIERAAQLGFRVLALTNHRYVMFSECWRDYALERGIILFPGVEASIERRHVLIINATPDADNLRTFADLRAYRRMNNSLIIAPHPFYPGLICLRGKLHQYPDLFDALEYNSVYTNFFNPNTRAVRFAQTRRLPLVGGSDTHRLSMLGRTYSMVHSNFTADSILQAIKHGHVKIVTQPIRGSEVLLLAARLQMASLRVDLNRLIHAQPLRCDYRPDETASTLEDAAEPLSTLRQTVEV